MVEQSYGVIPVFKDGDNYEVLLVRSKKYGHWGFPKGHHRQGEEPLSTARRELVEETGIADVVIIRDVILTDSWEFKRDGRKKEKKVAYWLGFSRTKDLQLPPSEIAAAEWLSLPRAIAKASFASQKKILQQVEEYLQGIKLPSGD